MPKSICRLLIYVNHGLVANFSVTNMAFNAIRQNKIFTKIFGFTVKKNIGDILFLYNSRFGSDAKPQESQLLKFRSGYNHWGPSVDYRQSDYNVNKNVCFTILGRNRDSNIHKQITVKPVYNGHSKIDKTKIFMPNGSFMKVVSIAECSPWGILQYV